MSCRKDSDILTIPYGNPFNIHLCRSDIAPANPSSITLEDIIDLRAFVVTPLGTRKEVPYKITTSGDIVLTFPSNLWVTSYSILLSGSHDSHPWRWKRQRAFRIADSSCDSTVQGMESVSPETYYLNDTLTFEIEGDTLHIFSDGHASLEGGTLALQETSNMSLTTKGDSIIATELKSIPR